MRCNVNYYTDEKILKNLVVMLDITPTGSYNAVVTKRITTIFDGGA